MFDESFGRSKLYFTTLQMLRVFSDVISETRRELQYLSVHHYNKEIYYQLSEFWDAKTDVKGLIASWGRILSLQEAAEKKLLDQIASKTVEIESLRDGLFNATSVREASRSISMNRAVILFTIVTVTYLPASFIATIFGTQLFNDEDVAGTINKFKITTVVVSITTFAIAILLVLLAAKLPQIKRSSTYRKWHGKVQHPMASEKVEEASSRTGEQTDQSGGEVPRSQLQKLTNRFRKKPKGNEDP
ncbi:hypothetical protein V8E51_003043 [Hyaloscypha variabilis]